MSPRDRDRFERLLAGVQVPSPWDVELLAEAVAWVVGRRIHVVSRPPKEGDGSYATVLAYPDAHYLFVRDDLHGLHRDQAICHELGHLLAGHLDQAEARPVPANVAALLPSLSPTMIARYLNRDCCYDRGREREAELIGTALLTRGRDEPTVAIDPFSRGLGEALS